MSTIYAEDRGITQMSHNDMPEIYIFGSQFRRMLRNVILEVGSYADMYDRNVQKVNFLNSEPHFGPQIYVPPGFP
jgi:hypothetical protein